MSIILASGNKGKIKEFQDYLNCDITAYKDVVGDIEIVEDGDTFAQNALIKAQSIYEMIDSKDAIVISDDSGISIEALGLNPGIYSARYAGEGANDKDNLQKVIDELNAKGVDTSKAFYTAAIAVVSKYGSSVVHGWMHGNVVVEPKGENGFGYDPIFIPLGFKKTLGELESEVKKKISHRTKAIDLALPIIEIIRRNNG